MSNTTSNNNNNIASLVSPNILANLKSSQQPKSFGDQLLKTGLAAGANVALNSIIATLYKQKTNLITEEIQLDVNHQSSLLKIENQYNINKKQAGSDEQKLSEIEKVHTAEVDFENKSYEKAKANLQEIKDKNEKDINTYLKDPFAKQKEKLKLSQERIKKLKSKSKEEKRKSRQQITKAVLGNIKKNIVPVLTLLLTNKIADIVSQNNTIKKLVDDTNKIIEDANTSNNPTKLNNAQLARDNAVKIIQNNEDKITKINNQIKRISTYINIFNTIVTVIGPVILSIPVPSPAPDITTTPKELFRRKVYEPTLKILNSLSALLPTILLCLQKAIQVLETYKAQLLVVNGVLDTNISSLTPIDITFGTSNISGADYGTYKGFKFALKEENNPKFIVQGNKRHYAVAIDSNDVEVLKSELSFTLDPNDLIEQLKLVIDRENLIG